MFLDDDDLRNETLRLTAAFSNDPRVRVNVRNTLAHTLHNETTISFYIFPDGTVSVLSPNHARAIAIINVATLEHVVALGKSLILENS